MGAARTTKPSSATPHAPPRHPSVNARRGRRERANDGRSAEEEDVDGEEAPHRRRPRRGIGPPAEPDAHEDRRDDDRERRELHPLVGASVPREIGGHDDEVARDVSAEDAVGADERRRVGEARDEGQRTSDHQHVERRRALLRHAGEPTSSGRARGRSRCAAQRQPIRATLRV